jgi:ABC-type transport system involved in multi-copper enzyme maturation permease subunit
MKNPVRSPFSAVFAAEVLLNTKRIAPYAMAILFGANALLWWGWGPAAGQGWATNSDFFIAGVLPVYSFLTLPLFTALIMADPVVRDFRTGVAPLIFCKPITRAEYLLGKFFGNFFVLVCCQATFVLVLFVLQGFRRPGMIVQDVRALPYLKHFVVFVVISHLVLAAFCFAVGTLTRNAKIVYALGVAFYPLYIAYQFLLKSLPLRWRAVLDPLLMNWSNPYSTGRSAEWLNQLIVTYDSELIANRAFMILIAGVCLTILYRRFTIAERPGKVEAFSTLSLSTAAEGVYYDSESSSQTAIGWFHPLTTEPPESLKKNEVNIVPLPAVHRNNAGIFDHLHQLVAALSIEFRLLRSERSLVVILPLAIVLSFLSLPFQAANSGVTYSAAFATNTANGLLLFLLGVIVFCTVELVHRDRELRIEPVLWSMPAANGVFLFSKFLTAISLALALIVAACFTATATQLLRGQTPLEISAYLIVYGIILFPTIAFIAAASLMLSVFLRDKYFAYAVCIAVTAGLIYLYKLGYNHRLYNPALYGLWTYPDLMGAGSGNGQVLTHRIYCLALSCVCLALAQLGFGRKSSKGFMTNGRVGSRGWPAVVMVVSIAVAVVTGLMIK